MLDAYLMRKSSSQISKIASLISNLGVSANQVSALGFSFGILAFAFISFDKTIIGLLCLIFNRLADGLDGAIARIKGPTSLGAFLDVVFDFIVYALIPMGFCIRNPNDAYASVLLLVSFFGTAVCFLAFAIFTAQLGEKNRRLPNKAFFYMEGPVEGFETFIFFSLTCIWPSYFSVFAFIFAFLCFGATIWRFAVGVHYLNCKFIDAPANPPFKD